MKYLLTISYDGSRFCGYQVQSGLPTIQARLQKSAESVFGCECKITGCSRTDSGVHARDFKATVEPIGNFAKIPEQNLFRALNAALPEEISVKSSQIVSDSFHVRYDVKLKEYEYLILNSEARDPFYNNRAWFYPKKLNCDLMNEGAKRIVGTNDFSSFMASGSSITDCVRTVYSCSVTQNGELISVKISANGFLYNMVRIIVGTLVDLSGGKIALDEIKDIIASRDRKNAGQTAPPCGLYLNRVEY